MLCNTSWCTFAKLKLMYSGLRTGVCFNLIASYIVIHCITFFAIKRILTNKNYDLHMGSHHTLESPSRWHNINLACWIWPGYPALNREYKTIIKMMVFAQTFFKPWYWVLKQRGWLEMTSIYLTLVWFKGLLQILILQTMKRFRRTSLSSQILSF